MKVVKGYGAPDVTTIADVDDLYVDLDTSDVYRCTNVNTIGEEWDGTILYAAGLDNTVHVWEALYKTARKLLEFDGDFTSREYTVMDSRIWLVKITDKVYSKDDFVGSELIREALMDDPPITVGTHVDTIEADSVITALKDTHGNDSTTVMFMGALPLVVSVSDANGHPGLPSEPGTYFACIFDKYGTLGMYTKSVSCITE